MAYIVRRALRGVQRYLRDGAATRADAVSAERLSESPLRTVSRALSMHKCSAAACRLPRGAYAAAAALCRAQFAM